MTDQELLDVYIHFAEFLSQICGAGSEIAVHNISNPEHSIVAIYNSLSGRQVGSPLTDLALDLIRHEAYTNADYLTNYTGKSKDINFLSSTYYIKNEGRLIGLLCVNRDMSTVKDMEQAIKSFLGIHNLTMPENNGISETLDLPVLDMMQKRISDIIAKIGIAPSKMSMNDKIKAVQLLNEDGVMMLKGAASEIAKQLNVSIPTIYRYLNKIDKPLR